MSLFAFVGVLFLGSTVIIWCLGYILDKKLDKIIERIKEIKEQKNA